MFCEKKMDPASKVGWIEVVCGSMFSGKTEELIRRIKRATIAKQNVVLFKPALDTRYSRSDIVSHNKNKIKSISIKNPNEIFDHIKQIKVIGIDEAQFFDVDIVEVCNQLANLGFRVIVAGLDMDFKGKPFGPIPNLMAIAEYVTKVNAICIKCGSMANYSHRTSPNKQLVELGETDKYEALCRNCYLKNIY